MKKIHTGIWLDFREAYIITLATEGDPVVQHIKSDVEHHAPKGSVRIGGSAAPHYAPADDRMLEKEKHSEHAYFEDILKHIGPTIDEIVIFGPAEAKFGLKKAIEKIKHYHPQLLGMLPAAYGSQNELVALVRNFYENPAAFLTEKEKEA